MKLMRGKKRLWMRLWSLLCALILGVGGILPMGVTEVKAETSSYTLHYFCSPDAQPVAHFASGGAVQFNSSVDGLDVWSGTAMVMNKDAEENWWSVTVNFDDSVSWWKYDIYEVPDSSMGSGLTESALSNGSWKFGENLWDGVALADDCDLYKNLKNGKIYYKNGTYTSSNPESSSGWKNFAELQTLIDGAKAKTESDYTVESWQIMKVALTEAEAITADSDRTVITEKYTALESAINGLVEASTGEDNEAAMTLHVYSTGSAPCVVTEGFDLEGQGLTKADVSVWGKNTYKMTSEGDNWWTITMKAPTGKSFEIYAECVAQPADSDWIMKFSDVTTDGTWEKSWKNFAENPYYKNGTFYATNPDARTFSDLQTLIQTAEEKKKEDYTEESFQVLQEALTAAKAITETNTSEEITAAYNILNEAIKNLTSSSLADAEIYVKELNLPEKFIKGVDVSSYVSLKDSGVTFYDFDGNEVDDAGFFNLLKSAGVNCVRVRVWNNPYNTSGKGYGGGNSDLNKAVTIGKLATDAGLGVLVDFHYSDFWADPGKQKAPKEWEGKSLEEKEVLLKSYTKYCLNTLKSAGVNVGMVQVGNETNNGIAGEFTREGMCRLFSAGSSAVRDVYPEAKVVLHFTNPESKDFAGDYAKSFYEYNVDYDVFATSYYPFWHGSLENLTSKLDAVATTYGKEVMVAETSYAVTWDDFDGHENTAPKDDQTLSYPVSVQGQADSLVGVMEAVNNVSGGKGIGMFYWEPAWISVGNAYNEDGSLNEEKLAENKAKWEANGSGWASSYSVEYDSEDAGVWYGGSAVDNQGLFDAFGHPLDSLNVFKYVGTGATTSRRPIAATRSITSSLYVGESYTYPATVTVYYNDGTTEEASVTWKEEERAQVDLSIADTYQVTGTTTVDGVSFTTLLTIKVSLNDNLLKNPGFEQGTEYWTITYKNDNRDYVSVKHKDKEANLGGNYSLHFYSEGKIEFTVEQTLEDLEEGYYTFQANLQGGTGFNDVIRIEAETESATMKANASLNGWKNWVSPTIEKILVKKGETLTVRLYVKTDPKGWATIDDLKVNGPHGTIVEEPEADDIVSYTSSTGIVADSISEDFFVPLKENIVVLSQGGNVKSELSGIYQAGTVAGVVIMGTEKEIVAQVGLTEQEINNGVLVKYYICDTLQKNIKEALRKQAVADGYRVGTIINIDLYRLCRGKVDAIRNIQGNLEVKIGVPSYLYKAGRQFSLMAIDRNGKVIILEDLDEDDKTITFKANYFGSYAIIFK